MTRRRRAPVVARARATRPTRSIEGLERVPVPHTALVIFGASGDLAKRKLLPALYNLAHEGQLPERFALIGVSRSPSTDDEFRELARESITEFSRREPDDDVLDALLSRMRYLSLTFDDADAYYGARATSLDEVDEEAGHPLNRCYYLSTAPEYFGIIPTHLKEAGLNRHDDVDVRCVIEKPFGTDLKSARALQATVSDAFREHQVYRIDHYLGKETVQNMMAFRFANYMFEPVWNRNFIDSVQITAAEDIGIGSRAGYYDSAGALRDLVQNHMMQLLTLLCMEPPVSFDADKVRDEKVKVLQAITPMTPAEVADAHGPRALPRRDGGRARTSSATSTRRASRTRPTRRPTPRCAWRSTTGAGRACRSACARASGSRASSPRSPSSSSPSRTWRSRSRARRASSPTS